MRKATSALMCLGLAVAAMITALYIGQAFEADRQTKREEAHRDLNEWRGALSRWIVGRTQQTLEPGFETGFRKGFIGGTSARNSIDFPISASLIETLAAREVEVDEIPAEWHLGFLRGFKVGWDCGWAGK